MMQAGVPMMLGGVWMWLVPVAVVAAAAWLVWRLSGGTTWSADDRIHTEELLHERYAAGELDDDDFERRLAYIRRN